VITYDEVLLNRAEALAQTGDAAGARALVNTVRANVPGDDLDDLDGTLSGQALLDAIYAERRVALMYEGHRWHDLVRTNRALDVLDIDRADFLLWPIPQREIDLYGGNPGFQQNPGY
jgi:hypothetical protein